MDDCHCTSIRVPLEYTVLLPGVENLASLGADTLAPSNRDTCTVGMLPAASNDARVNAIGVAHVRMTVQFRFPASGIGMTTAVYWFRETTAVEVHARDKSNVCSDVGTGEYEKYGDHVGVPVTELWEADHNGGWKGEQTQAMKRQCPCAQHSTSEFSQRPHRCHSGA